MNIVDRESPMTVYAGPAVWRRAGGAALALEYVPTAEGRALKEGSAWTYEYHLTDHLGNVRMTFTGSAAGGGGSIRQRRGYYPHGLEQVGAFKGADSGPEQPFTYNGKEFDEELGLRWHHYGVRFYDVQLGRWPTMDPVDQFASPYVYVGGDPVNLVDPDGAQAAPQGECIGCPRSPLREGAPTNGVKANVHHMRGEIVTSGVLLYLREQINAGRSRGDLREAIDFTQWRTRLLGGETQGTDGRMYSGDYIGAASGQGQYVANSPGGTFTMELPSIGLSLVRNIGPKANSPYFNLILGGDGIGLGYPQEGSIRHSSFSISVSGGNAFGDKGSEPIIFRFNNYETGNAILDYIGFRDDIRFSPPSR